MKEKIYEEIGANYRFFARWRQAVVAGLFVVLGAVLTLCISAYKDAQQLMWIIPFSASPVGLLLWLIDARTMDMYHAAIRAGKNLEGEFGGFYTEISEKVVIPKGESPYSRPTQTMALQIMFFGTSVGLLALSIWFFCRYA